MEDLEKTRERLMRRLKSTRRNETICLAGWETEILVNMIEERKNEHEQTSDNRESD